jgi:L-lactate dehydrogenase complex protein LldG
MSARDDILAAIRRSGAMPDGQDPEARMAAHRANLVPQRAASLDPPGRAALFVAMAEEVQATVARVGADAVAAEVARYLASGNLPPTFVMSPDPALDQYGWDAHPFLEIRRGRAVEADAAGVTGAFAGIARPAR